MSYTIVSCLCLALLAGVYADGKKERIIGGKDANIADFPYQVSLRLKGKHYCGGTIIGDRHILTAAHCIDGIILPRLRSLVSVYAGSSLSKGTSGKAYKVKKAVIHRGWTADEEESYKNDIGLITLTEDIEFNDKTKKADLPTEDVELGDKAVITGWGINRFPSKVAMVQLQKADMKLIPNSDCMRILSDDIFKGQVCAYQKRGVGVCSGDSGGPLAVGNTVVGIASWVVPCGKGKPDVYTKVYHYLDWIEKAMEA